MASPIHILLLDDYHLGDPLFGQSLARSLSQEPARTRRVLIVHGAGEEVDRVFEGRGLLPKWSDGTLVVAENDEQQLVERAIREINKRLTSVLTEFSVPAVGIQGSDRGLIKVGPDRGIVTGPADWLLALVQTGSIPVVSSLAAAADKVVVAAVGSILQRLVESFSPDQCVVVAFKRGEQSSVHEKGSSRQQNPTEDLQESGLHDDIQVLAGLAGSGYEVRLTSVQYAISSDSSRFARVSSGKCG